MGGLIRGGGGVGGGARAATPPFFLGYFFNLPLLATQSHYLMIEEFSVRFFLIMSWMTNYSLILARNFNVDL